MTKVTINNKANSIRIIWIFVQSFFITLKYSLKTIWHSLFINETKRSRIDRVLNGWGTSIIRCVRLKWNISGDIESQIIAGRSVVFMCNHGSAYDIPLAFSALPYSIRMIAKKELFKIPILSRAMKMGEFPSVDRQNRKQAAKDLDYARNLMKSGIKIWIFPEGTRSKDGRLQKLKKGGVRLAIDTRAIIIPIVMQDIEHILPNKKWLKMRLNQQVNIKVGRAIDCKEYSLENRNQVLDLVYNQMKEMLEHRSD